MNRPGAVHADVRDQAPLHQVDKLPGDAGANDVRPISSKIAAPRSRAAAIRRPISAISAIASLVQRRRQFVERKLLLDRQIVLPLGQRLDDELERSKEGSTRGMLGLGG